MKSMGYGISAMVRRQAIYFLAWALNFVTWLWLRTNSRLARRLGSVLFLIFVRVTGMQPLTRLDRFKMGLPPDGQDPAE